MSWNIWVTAIYRIKPGKNWKPVFAGGQDYTSSGKNDLVTAEPICCEIDIMDEFDHCSVSVDDLPTEIVHNWGLDKPDNGYELATIAIEDYRSICATIVNKYERDEMGIFKALGCNWDLDPEWGDADMHYTATGKTAKNELTYPISKELLTDWNNGRSRYVKALKNLAMLNAIDTLVPSYDGDTKKFFAEEDREIRLVMIAG